MQYLYSEILRPFDQPRPIRSSLGRLASITLFLGSLAAVSLAESANSPLLLAQATAQGDPKAAPSSLPLNPATAAPAPVADLSPPSTGTKILLITGIDYPGHHWQQTSPVLRDLLEKDPRLKVRIVADPNVLASPALQQWDAVIIHFMDWEVPGPGPEARANLKRFLEQGKGLMLTHFACGAWDNNEWPEFRNLAGRVWDPKRRPHDVRGPFLVEIADPEHAITKGMQSFETNDELYTCLAGEAPIHVIAQARSKVDAKEYPMAFVLRYGQGRVFHCVLGHDPLAYTNTPAVGELMRRGCAWAAGVEPLPRRQGQ
jgi:type 1 glutamine amidotransferase